MAVAGCKICGAAHRSCGPVTAVIPVDERIESRKDSGMSLKRFITQVEVGRSVIETIIKLPAEEGEKLGLKEYEKTKAKAKPAVANKAAKPTANKAKAPAANKAAKPTDDAAAASADGASDPGASEA